MAGPLDMTRWSQAGSKNTGSGGGQGRTAGPHHQPLAIRLPRLGSSPGAKSTPARIRLVAMPILIDALTPKAGTSAKPAAMLPTISAPRVLIA